MFIIIWIIAKRLFCHLYGKILVLLLQKFIFCNALVLSSDCSSGPKEILSDKKGLLFKNNNKEDFISQFQLLNDLTKDEEKKLKINAKKFVKNFSLIRHFNKFKKI